MKTLTLTMFENYLAWFALVHSPLDGLRLSDLDTVEKAKKRFVCDKFDDKRTVELAADEAHILGLAWRNLPVGKLARTDDLPDAVKSVTAQLEG